MKMTNQTSTTATAPTTAGILTYATDAEMGEIKADTLDAAYDQLRAKITDKMIEDGATLWVEDASGARLTMGENRD